MAGDRIRKIKQGVSLRLPQADYERSKTKGELVIIQVTYRRVFGVDNDHFSFVANDAWPHFSTHNTAGVAGVAIRCTNTIQV